MTRRSTGLDYFSVTNYTSYYRYAEGRATSTTYAPTAQCGGGDSDFVSSDGDLAAINLELDPNGTPASRSGQSRIWTSVAWDGTASKDARQTIVTMAVDDTGGFSGAVSGMVARSGEPAYSVQATHTTYESETVCGPVPQQTRFQAGWGKCAQYGDSGSPVVRWYSSDDTFGFAGIVSGSNLEGDSDYYLGQFDLGNCTLWFTPTAEVVDRWGGSVAP